MENLKFIEQVWDDSYDDMDLPVYILMPRDDEWEKFKETYSRKYMPHILESIGLALREDLLKVPVFKVLFITSGETMTAAINRNDFDEALQHCIDYFTETEEYEKCAIAHKLINNEEEHVNA